MDRFDRIFTLHTLLSGRRTGIPLEDLEARLECTRATVFRALNTLKDHLHAPVIFDPNTGGYRYADESQNNVYQLPGLWFNPAELQALAVLQRLLEDAGGGILAQQLGPIAKRIDYLVQHQKLNLGEAASRLRFPALAARPAGDAFQIAASATLQRRKLWLEYHARSEDRRTERTISPQRLTHYREGWYLDAWDESRDALRTFAVDRIVRATVLDERAVDIPECDLDEHYASAYGIFGGTADKIAALRFSKERARWVAAEKWHPHQQGEYLSDGRYELRIPYREQRELVMDVLRHGAEVEVVEPASLRAEVAEHHRRAAALYD